MDENGDACVPRPGRPISFSSASFYMFPLSTRMGTTTRQSPASAYVLPPQGVNASPLARVVVSRQGGVWCRGGLRRPRLLRCSVSRSLCGERWALKRSGRTWPLAPVASTRSADTASGVLGWVRASATRCRPRNGPEGAGPPLDASADSSVPGGPTSVSAGSPNDRSRGGGQTPPGGRRPPRSPSAAAASRRRRSGPPRRAGRRFS